MFIRNNATVSICVAILFDFILLFRSLSLSANVANRGRVFVWTGVTEHDFNLQVVSKFLPPGVIAHRHHQLPNQPETCLQLPKVCVPVRMSVYLCLSSPCFNTADFPSLHIQSCGFSTYVHTYSVRSYISQKPRRFPSSGMQSHTCRQTKISITGKHTQITSGSCHGQILFCCLMLQS